MALELMSWSFVEEMMRALAKQWIWFAMALGEWSI